MLRAFNEEFLATLATRRDPVAEAAVHARAVALMREVGAAVFEQKLIAHPLLVDEADLAALARAGGLLLRAQVKLLDHLRATRGDADVLEMFRIPARLLPFMRWENLAHPEETIGRLDIIPTRHGYSFCELNVIPAVGGGEAHPCGEMYFHTFGYPDTDRPPGPLQLLASHYAHLVRKRGYVRVVILDSVEHGRHGYPRQLLLQRYLRAAVPGLSVELCDEESYPAKWLTPAEGARTLVHRMFTHEEVTDGFVFLEKLWQSGAAIAGFESDLRMSKRFLVLMCDPQYRPLLDAEELAAIDQFVPHSYALTEEKVASAIERRAELVFKWDDSASYGGNGVLVGSEHEADELERTLRQHGVARWICQQAVEAEELPLRAAEDAEPLPYRLVLGMYWYGGATSGLLVRGSRASRVVNASSPTGRIGWAYPVSIEGREALIRHARERREMAEFELAPLELSRSPQRKDEEEEKMTFDGKTQQAPAASDAQSRAAHDSTPPPKLVEFMMQSWAPAEEVRVIPYPHADSTQARRERVGQQYPGEVLVIPSGVLKVRSNDEYYPFRACSDFVYLTGHQDPDSVLVLVPEARGADDAAEFAGAGGHRPVLFVDPNPGKRDITFFTDRIKGELWEGPRLGVPGCAARYQIEDTRPLAELRAFLEETVKPAPKLRVLRGHAAEVEGWIDRSSDEQRAADLDFGVFLSELRLCKDKGEIAELRGAIDLTKRGFEDVIRGLRTAQNERELENAFFANARLTGNGTGYQTIVAAGAHACTLHWRKNDGPVRKGELLLLDGGVENKALYTADITRVLPVTGTFSPEQREVYQLVLAAQRAALATVAPGVDFMEPNKSAMKVLAHGLEKLGILPCSAEEALKEEHQFYKRYSLHNISHMLGLDVHDCAKARAEVYKYGPLQPGMVLTIEPGIYFQLDDLTVPEKYRGIGVRIEDDVLVTETGYDNLSAHIPTDPDEVERWMAEVWARSDAPKPADAR